MNMNQQNQKGFTLIELVVVIGIILLLLAIIMVSLSTAQMRGRDSKRSSDMAQVVRALELYRTNNDTYPPQGGTKYGGCNSDNCLTVLTDELVPTYLPYIPVDPRLGNTTNGYRYCKSDAPRDTYQIIMRSEKDNAYCTVRTGSPITGAGYSCWTTNGVPDFPYCD